MSAIQMRCDDCGGEYMAGVVGRTPWPAHKCPNRTPGRRISFKHWPDSEPGDYCKVPAGKDPRATREQEVWYIRDPAGRVGALVSDSHEFVLTGRKLTVKPRHETYGQPTIMGVKWSGEIREGVFVGSSELR